MRPEQAVAAAQLNSFNPNFPGLRFKAYEQSTAILPNRGFNPNFPGLRFKGFMWCSRGLGNAFQS